MTDHTTIITVLITAATLEVIRWLVNRFLNKTVGTEYVTVAGCRVCREKCKTDRSAKSDELVKLVRLIRSEVRGLRVVVLKHLVHSKVPAEAIDAVIEKLENVEAAEEALL